MKVLISAFSFALAQEDVANSELENSKIFQAIEMDAGRYSNYRNSLDRKYARSQAGFGTINFSHKILCFFENFDI